MIYLGTYTCAQCSVKIEIQGTKELNQRPDLPAKDIFLNLELKDEVFSGELYHDR